MLTLRNLTHFLAPVSVLKALRWEEKYARDFKQQPVMVVSQSINFLVKIIFFDIENVKIKCVRLDTIATMTSLVTRHM